MEIFDYAIKLEKEGEEYYRQLADNSDKEGIKNILLMLARDEVKHAETLKKMKQDEDTSMTETDILDRSKTIFVDMKDELKNIVSKDEELNLYRKALEVEKRSIDFYQGKVEQAGSDKQKEILNRIADEEKRHYHLLKNLEELLLRPKQWVEDAEFYHLEDY